MHLCILDLKFDLKFRDHNGYALRLMQSISYTKQYDLDTGEVSYCEVRQSIVRLHSTLAIEDSHAHLNNGGY